MKLEKNLDRIAANAKLHAYENESFQNYLKGQNSKDIDEIVHRLNDQISSEIVCVECGSCCNNLRPVVGEAEMSKFAKAEDMERFRYVEGFTCKHLQGKSCLIYLDRPNECRDYPYMDRDNFTSRASGTIQNYAVCPIVYNIFEQLKAELNWV